MDKDYVERNRVPRHSNRGNRKKSGPPVLFYLVPIVFVLIIVLIIVAVAGGKDDKDKDSKNDVSSAVSSAVVSSSIADDSAVSSDVTSEVVSSEPQATPPPEKVPTGAVEKLDTQVQIGDTGYEYYNFVEDRANNYITTVCDAGEQLGSVKLYNIVVPTSMDIMLPESYIEENGINSSDQSKAINYIYSSINAINPNVTTVPVFDALKLHNNDYIYFRTDHHWTQLGAYYAYDEFCKAKGITAIALEDFEKKSYDGFLGSFYNDLPSDAMASNPDTVEAYIPNDTTLLNYTDASGNTVEGWPVIQDGSAYDTENLYLIFCAADQPYEEITNSAISDGSACIVVKESFGNVFIPFLTNHYQTVYVVDYRYYGGDISDLAQEKGVSDVILINNISMTRNEGLISALSSAF